MNAGETSITRAPPHVAHGTAKAHNLSHLNLLYMLLTVHYHHGLERLWRG